MEGFDFGLGADGAVIGTMLYHPGRPCANPAAGAMMNEQRAIGVKAFRAKWMRRKENASRQKT
jgi:hypothetical protein